MARREPQRAVGAGGLGRARLRCPLGDVLEICPNRRGDDRRHRVSIRSPRIKRRVKRGQPFGRPPLNLSGNGTAQIPATPWRLWWSAPLHRVRSRATDKVRLYSPRAAARDLAALEHYLLIAIFSSRRTPTNRARGRPRRVTTGIRTRQMARRWLDRPSRRRNRTRGGAHGGKWPWCVKGFLQCPLAAPRRVTSRPRCSAFYSDALPVFSRC